MREFIWNEYCDWYLEIIKPQIYGEGENSANTLAVASYVLRNVMILLHPLMPFITEEIYQRLPHKKESIVIEDWPLFNDRFVFETDEEEVALLKDIVVSIRNMRASMGVPNSAKVNVVLFDEKGVVNSIIGYIKYLAKVDNLMVIKDDKKPEKSIANVAKGVKIYVIGRRCRYRERKK